MKAKLDNASEMGHFVFEWDRNILLAAVKQITVHEFNVIYIDFLWFSHNNENVMKKMN